MGEAAARTGPVVVALSAAVNELAYHDFSTVRAIAQVVVVQVAARVVLDLPISVLNLRHEERFAHAKQ
jgi:hypothetical protein